MHGNAISHSTSVIQAFLISYGIEGERLIVWPSVCRYLNPITNLWSIIKHVYAGRCQFTSKDILWATIKAATEEVKTATIKI